MEKFFGTTDSAAEYIPFLIDAAGSSYRLAAVGTPVTFTKP
jgi:hypothetical protein